MTDLRKEPQAFEGLSRPAKGVPLRGYLVKEEEGRVWIQDRSGTWLVEETDILAREDLTYSDPRFKGRGVCVFVAEGAQIIEIRHYRIQPSRRPLALIPTAGGDVVKGYEAIKALEMGWIRHLGLLPNEAAGPTADADPTTVSLRPPSGPSDRESMIFEDDDCGW